MNENELITHLQNPTLYEHPIKRFQVIETHLSWVLLTGLYAYKIKKPVHFNFVDFSTLEKRKFFCEEELRLNHRLSGFLYIGLVAITGSKQTPQLNGSGPVLDYAIKMEEFSEDQLFSVLALKNMLSFSLIEKLANKIAHFHLKTESVPEDSVYGTLVSIQAPMQENFEDCLARTKSKSLLEKLHALHTFSMKQFEALKSFFVARKANGFIRDCHGDLHLGNIVLIHHLPVVFDCLEFNPAFRCIDVFSEIAFLIMDLKEKKAPLLANGFLNHYLSMTEDYEGLRLLSFYEIYRAMVRAKVALLSPGKSSRKNFANYVKLADALMQTSLQKPFLIITHGVSGSGKTIIAELLALELNALHIRSDVERKRLFGSQSMEMRYSSKATLQTHLKLLEMSDIILQSGHSVIVDASFLKHDNRSRFAQLATKLNLPFIILQFEASVPVLEKRITDRLAMGVDASDATLEVLEQQLKNIEPLTAAEMNSTGMNAAATNSTATNATQRQYCMKINTEKKTNIAALAKRIKNIKS